MSLCKSLVHAHFEHCGVFTLISGRTEELQATKGRERFPYTGESKWLGISSLVE